MNNSILSILLPLALLSYRATAQQPQKDIIAHNRQIGQRYFNEVWNKGNLDLLDTLLAPAYINHTPSAPTVPGPAGLKPIVRAIRKAFPDLHYEIEEIIATPEYVTMRVTMTGT